MVQAASNMAVSSRFTWKSGTASLTTTVAPSTCPSNRPLTVACGNRNACSTLLAYASAATETTELMLSVKGRRASTEKIN
jgi:hypothetical protein